MANTAASSHGESPRRRRVVTGVSATGKSVVVSDELVDPITLALLPGSAIHKLWGFDEPPTIPTRQSQPRATSYIPPPGGVRFSSTTLGPDTVIAAGDLDVEAGVAELIEKLPDLAAVLEPDHPGMHTTDTVELLIVVRGSPSLELDEGVLIELAPGDCVVQQGTRHAWHNRTGQPCVLAGISVGALRAPLPPTADGVSPTISRSADEK